MSEEQVADKKLKTKKMGPKMKVISKKTVKKQLADEKKKSEAGPSKVKKTKKTQRLPCARCNKQHTPIFGGFLSLY